MYANSEEAKKAGWHSRRHQNSDAQTETRDARRQKAQDRRERALARQAARAERSDREQLDVLYNRGINCGREWNRLVARIEAEEGSATAAKKILKEKK